MTTNKTNLDDEFLNDDVLEDMLKKFLTTTNTNDFKNIAKTIENRDIIMTFEIEFLDKELEAKYANSINKEIANSEKICKKTPKTIELYEQKYICLYTGKERLPLEDEDKYIEKVNFRDILTNYILGNPNYFGVIINPNYEQVAFNEQICSYIFNGCKEEDYQQIYEETQKQLEPLYEQLANQLGVSVEQVKDLISKMNGGKM